MELKQVNISELKEWDKNPRQNDKAVSKLAKLIEQHGFINPVIATRDNIIRAGHTRVKAAKKLKLTHVPVIYIDLEIEQAELYAIADNKSSEFTSWDIPKLVNCLSDLDTGQYDLSLSGFDLFEIEKLLNDSHLDKNKKETIEHNPLNIETAMYVSNNDYGFPELRKDIFEVKELIPFHFINLSSIKSSDFYKTVHFFIDDYRFERLWNNPKQYINVLKKFNGIFMPDFSTYSDYPKALRIFNYYRRFWLSAFFQDNKINVIPVIRYDSEFLEECLKPIPKNSIIAFSTVRMLSGKQEDFYDKFQDNFQYVIDFLKPVEIIMYGNKINLPDIDKSIKIKWFDSYQKTEFKNLPKDKRKNKNG